MPPIVLKTWPMKPSGVQLARPIGRPAARRAAARPRRCVLVGREHHAEGRDRDVEAPSANGSASASAARNVDRQALGLGARAAALEQRRHVVGRGDVAEAARRGERGVAVAGRDVQHPLARPEVEGLAEALADDLQGRADDGVVAGRPGRLLLGLDGLEVCRCRWLRGARRCGGCIHLDSPSSMDLATIYNNSLIFTTDYKKCLTLESCACFICCAVKHCHRVPAVGLKQGPCSHTAAPHRRRVLGSDDR